MARFQFHPKGNYATLENKKVPLVNVSLSLVKRLVLVLEKLVYQSNVTHRVLCFVVKQTKVNNKDNKVKFN